MNRKRSWVATGRLKAQPPFKGLFPIKEETIQVIADHMKTHGYDESQPIVVWDRTENEASKHALVVIDGHTRLDAAKRIGLSPDVRCPDEIPG